MSEGKECSTSSPTAPMALAYQAMAENTCRFCWPFPEENVFVSHRCTFKVIEMASTTSTKTIDELRRLFAAYGLPEQVVTDNGPQFVSQEFIKTSPYHLASNGAVERLVQTFKRA